MLKNIIKENENIKPNSREINVLKEHLPQFFDKDGAFNLNKFKKLLNNDDVKITKEGYELNFLGKSYARYLSATETETVIVPDTKHNNEELNQNSENLYIVGDNLDALKHLLHSYSGKIKCIYIDPPYNTGSDGFVYPDNFGFSKEFLSEKMGVSEDEAERIINLKGKSSHSAWLTFMYPRLILARELLSEDGVIFISIDDNEQANLKLMCDEIFGEENKIGILPTIMNLKGNQDEFAFAGTHEYTIVYSKQKDKLIIKGLEVDDEEIISDWMIDEKGYYKKGASLISTGQNAPREHRPKLWFPILYKDENLKLPEKSVLDAIYDSENKLFNDEFLDEYISAKKIEGYLAILPFVGNKKARWRWSYSKLQRQLDEVIISKGKNGISLNKKQRPELADLPSKKVKTLLYKPEYSSGNGTNEVKNIFGIERLFDNPKPLNLIKDLISISVDEMDIVLDFFSGSATTAEAVMKLNAEDGGNRKYILVQLPEEIKEDKPAYKVGYRTIDEIGRERIRRAAKKIKEETNADIDCGFKLYRLETPENKAIDRLYDFDADAMIFDDYVNLFALNKESGKDVILTTWLNKDNFGLGVNAHRVKLDTYEIDVYSSTAYIIKNGLTSDDVIMLIELIESGSLNINRIVIYPYSLEFHVLNEMKKNFSNLKNNIEVKIIERY